MCPHCNCKLSTHHKRNSYNVLVCPNDNCSFYIKNKKKLNNNDYEDLKTNSGGFKLRYTFRLFNFTFNDIKNDVNSNHYIESKINIDKIRHSKYVLGLILTYYVNYGLSSRKTSQIMREIHGVKVSYQTVINYAEAAAKRIEKLNEEFDYSEIGLSDTLTSDETYIKVAGKTNYVFFFSDTKKKIITSYRIFPDRDSLCAIKSIYQRRHQPPRTKSNIFIKNIIHFYSPFLFDFTLRRATSRTALSAIPEQNKCPLPENRNAHTSPRLPLYVFPSIRNNGFCPSNPIPVAKFRNRAHDAFFRL